MRKEAREARARKAAQARWERHNADKAAREALLGAHSGATRTVAVDGTPAPPDERHGETPEEFAAKRRRVMHAMAADIMADPVAAEQWEAEFGEAWRARHRR